MAAAQSFKHSCGRPSPFPFSRAHLPVRSVPAVSLFAASGLDDDDFDVRAASALDESKDLLRFVAEAAPVAFTCVSGSHFLLGLEPGPTQAGPDLQ